MGGRRVLVVMGEDSTDDTRQVQLTLDGEEQLTAGGTVFSAHVGTNADLFPDILALHVEPGARIADVTYGNGTFWNHVPPGMFDLVASDIDPEKSPAGDSVDCRALPYDDNAFDGVVLDPPYAAGLLRRNSRAGTGSHRSFRTAYTSDSADTGGSNYHAAVRDLYREAGAEAKRVITDSGTAIVKTQDEVVANTNEFTHMQIRDDYQQLGFELCDLFVLVRTNAPSSTGVDSQVHARKNHSYFLVFDA